MGEEIDSNRHVQLIPKTPNESHRCYFILLISLFSLLSNRR